MYWVDHVQIETDKGNNVTYTIPSAPSGKVFVGWKGGDGKIHATGEALSHNGNVFNFEAVFIDETYHGRLEIGSTTPST